MKYIYHYDTVGRITQMQATSSREVDPEQMWGNFVVTDERVDRDGHRVDIFRRALVALPPRPSEVHHFDYSNLEWVVDLSAAWVNVRAERDRLLTACDWVALADSPLTPEKKQAWATYRQALRDVTLQRNPTNLVWPEAPNLTRLTVLV